MRRWKRGTLLETQIVLAGYGILIAVLLPRFYPGQPIGLVALWLAGLWVAHTFTKMLSEESPSRLYLWAYLLLTFIPALALYFDFPPGGLFLIIQPYVAFRIHLHHATRAVI